MEEQHHIIHVDSSRRRGSYLWSSTTSYTYGQQQEEGEATNGAEPSGAAAADQTEGQAANQTSETTRKTTTQTTMQFHSSAKYYILMSVYRYRRLADQTFILADYVPVAFSSSSPPSSLSAPDP